MEPRVEALQQLDVDLSSRHVAEGRQDVKPDQVVVALAGGVLKLDDVEPLRDGSAHGDVALRVLVLIDLALELAQDALGVCVRRGRLTQLAPLARE